MSAHPIVRVLLLLYLQCCLSGWGGGVDAQNNVTETSCINKENCRTCIRTAGCQWCSQPGVSTENNTLPFRCMLAASAPPNWCSGHVVNPQPSAVKVMDVPLSKDVQIKPQYVKLRLRVDQAYDLHLQYAQAKDYPVDLYFLMDLSASMADDKDKLSTLGNKLADVMTNITSNFRLGFGSFVDKVVMPYVSTVPSKLQSPCDVPGTNPKKKCAPPYSFKNHMPLSDETMRFSDSVKEAPVSGNLDAPEGGFDALMQAIVCQKDVGWRDKARHLIVFSTDAGFHIAGDGRLGGIIEPNDGRCHMENGEYSQASSLMYDYPSISQINQKAKEHNMNLIFAITERQVGLYKMLADRIKGSSYGALNDGSSNVVDLVRGQYDKLVDSVILSDNASDVLEVRYFSSCLNDTEKEVRECGGLRVNTSVGFTARIRVVECPEDKSKRIQRFEIKPVAVNESLIVEIEIICDCDCEKEGNAGFEKSATACTGHGTLECGVCACEEGYVGRSCECKGNSADNTTDQSTCKMDNSSSTVCSGLGNCKCGVCECKKRPNTKELIYGKFCECDNFSCKRYDGKVCSGPERGTCDCGKCLCHASWGGDACQCLNANNTCISKGEVCSGQGKCVCGGCVCDQKGRFRYSGKYCEECPACPGQRCEELRSCVECLADQPPHSRPLAAEECSYKCEVEGSKIQDFELVDRLEEQDDSKLEHMCRSPDNAGCTFIFMYTYVDNNLHVKAQRTKECGSDVNILGLVLGVTGSTVIIGLLLLIAWKVLTSIHDKREYAKFEKERAQSKWDRGDNPLYKPSTSTFSNPTFGGH